ncbi:hypothetical protein CPG38_01865 [Malaciobacter marinus]|uniref:DUF4435 domain-containing protein n=1 Tax=Malaciobacter marinus TaxID=505249 RepID=UPI000C07E065|nr:DUF4435 domain-containing protein [Malaciobacter marinus]PHO13763.1 hypothetical protein CPG38_01865 [Malaciobacter marinus]
MLFYDKDNINNAIIDDISSAVTFGCYDVVVYIENEEDERFWRFVLENAKPNIKIKFDSQFREKTNENIGQGKKELYKFKDVIKNHNGEALICLDSDFDYINNFNDINNNPYIIQTYAYSVENYSCSPHALNLTRSSLLIQSDFNFKEFFSSFSELLDELIIFNIILKDEENSNIKKIFTTYFSKVDSFSSLENFNSLLDFDELKNIVNTEIERIKGNNVYEDVDFHKVKDRIISDDLIYDSQLLMYFNGHTVFDIMLKIMKKMQSINFENQRNIIKDTYPPNQIPQKMREYKNNELCSKTALLVNFHHCYWNESCKSFQQIIEDVKSVI